MGIFGKSPTDEFVTLVTNLVMESSLYAHNGKGDIDRITADQVRAKSLAADIRASKGAGAMRSARNRVERDVVVGSIINDWSKPVMRQHAIDLLNEIFQG